MSEIHNNTLTPIQLYRRLSIIEQTTEEYLFRFSITHSCLPKEIHSCIDHIFSDFQLPKEFDSLINPIDKNAILNHLLQHIEMIVSGYYIVTMSSLLANYQPHQISRTNISETKADTDKYTVSGDFIRSYHTAYQMVPINKISIPIPLKYFHVDDNSYIKLKMRSMDKFYSVLGNFFGVLLSNIPDTYFELLPPEILMIITGYIKFDLDIKLFYRETSFYDVNGNILPSILPRYIHYCTYIVTNEVDNPEDCSYVRTVITDNPTEITINIRDDLNIYDYNSIIISGSNIDITNISIHLDHNWLIGTIYNINKDIAKIFGTSFEITPECYLFDVGSAFEYIRSLLLENTIHNLKLSIKLAKPMINNFNVYLFKQ